MCDHCGCRAFPAIAELTAEHEQILARAWALAEAGRVGRTVAPAEVDELARLLDVHVLKEETGLYPELIARRRLSADELADLEAEHRDLHDSLNAATFDRRAFYALAAHIEVEETGLFPAAMLGFEDEDWDALDGAHRAARAPA
jgi:hypothetical protein